jgi:hypothetical protein
VAVIRGEKLDAEQRHRGWPTQELPVPVDLLVYTQAEWARLDDQSRFYQTLLREGIWLYDAEEKRSKPDPGC